MIIHIFPYEKFTASYKNYIDVFFGCTNHKFLIYGYNDSYEMKINDEDYVKYFNSAQDLFKDNMIVQELLNCEKIIVHCCYILLGLNTEFSEIIQKCYLVFWGGDIYWMNKILRKNPIKLTKSLFERKNYIKLINKSAAVVTLIGGDYNVLKKITHYGGKHLIGKYKTDANIKQRFISNPKSTKPYLVLVGNSATKTNQLEQVISILSKYKNENVKFVFPLSYGNEKYRNKILKLGKKKLGDKFYPLTEFMAYERYMELLSTCSVGVFNHKRQQAMGNINALVLYGAKTYIRSDTSMWEEFVVNRKIKHFDIESIKELSFEEFMGMKSNIIENNKKQLQKYASEERFIELWSNIFND